MNILKHDVDLPVNALSALFEKNVSTLHIRPFAVEQCVSSKVFDF